MQGEVKWTPLDISVLVAEVLNEEAEAAAQRENESVSPSPDNNEWASIAASAKCWAQSGNAYFPVNEVVSSIPPGAYRCRASNSGPFLEKMPVEIDDLLHLPDAASEKLLEEFKKFWTLKDNFVKRGFTYKRGFLLHGPPGGGKTSTIWQMTQEVVEKQDGIVIFVEDASLATTCISMTRRIEPNRPIIGVIEDIDALLSRHGDHGYLALLDGENQISNIVFVATTNYPEDLDERIRNRPSRFDTVMHIGMPSPAARRMYFKTKEPALGDDELERWVDKTDGFSIAHLREVIVAIKCFEQTEDELFTRLDDMRFVPQSSNGKGGTRTKVGFN